MSADAKSEMRGMCVCVLNGMYSLSKLVCTHSCAACKCRMNWLTVGYEICTVIADAVLNFLPEFTVQGAAK